MKNLKILLSLVMVATWSISLAKEEIELEHVFENEWVSFRIGMENGKANYYYDEGTSNPTTIEIPMGCFYYTEQTDSSYHVKIYNSDYSLNTDENYIYNFTPPAGYKVSYMNTSQKLFDTDDDYEFMVCFYNSNADRNEYNKLILYDEDGTVIKDFGTGNYFSFSNVLYIIDNQYKYIIYRGLYDNENRYYDNTEIYSVPGTPAENSLRTVELSKTPSPFPNPSQTIVNLPYQLKQGEKAEMRICNLNGQLIETKQVDYQFDKIRLNVSNYQKGIYVYEVNGISSRFIVQ